MENKITAARGPGMQSRTAGSSLAFISRDKSFRLEAEKQVTRVEEAPWRLSPSVRRGRRWLTKRKAARLPRQGESPTPTPTDATFQGHQCSRSKPAITYLQNPKRLGEAKATIKKKKKKVKKHITLQPAFS